MTAAGARLKVLHVWSVAGVAEVLAKFMDRIHGTQSTVLVRRKYDRFGFNQHSFDDGTYRFSLRAVMEARKSDVVQVHNWDTILPWIGRFSSVPSVVTYHNFNIGKEWEARRKYWSAADCRVISTPGVLDQTSGAVFIPVTVDTDLFTDAHDHAPGTALTQEYGATDEAEALAKQHGLELTVIKRDEAPIPHLEMPKVLNKYEYYIDIKRPYKTNLPIIEATGKTTLEALACGCKVIRWDGKVLEGFPDVNRPEKVVAQYFELYTRLASGKG